ncbi:MAG TPA: glutamine synthetase family protein [Actinomycetota bacterium]|nr:glutamine synthetase family protein [Actinomycetota bacterium]
MDPAAQRALAEIEGLGARFVRLWFTDVLGFLKSFAIPSEELEKAFREGVGFDGSSIEGFARAEEADMLARPDPATLGVWPGGGQARMFCDITHPDGVAFAGDPREVLRRVLARADGLGYRVLTEPEVEFFLSRSPERFEPLDRGGYFDLAPSEDAERVIATATSVLEALGIHVALTHHEDAPSQHELGLAPDGALATADALVTLRMVVKEAAQSAGLHATFMPKPAGGIQGSGLHTHLRLLEGDRNALYDPTGAGGLSKIGRSFVAGLLEHAPAITAVTNQWVNSYKRLVPGFEAPVYVCWGRRNPSALVRVPADRPDDERACRIEYRAPDPACNPYLAFALIVAAGLDGVERELEPPPELNEDVRGLDPRELRAAGVRPLPEDLRGALEAMERSDLVPSVMGEHVFEWFVRNKREEWERARAEVTPAELERSFPLL